MSDQLRHAGVTVKDLETSIKWYSSFLGAEVVSRSHETWGKRQINVAKLDNGIELVEGPWKNHIAVNVRNAEDYYQDVLHFKRTDKVVVAFIEDPDGNIIECVEEIS